jgi:hypothetical protein
MRQGRLLRSYALTCLLLAPFLAGAADTSGDEWLASRSFLGDLERFVHERGGADHLTAHSMVGLMTDWYQLRGAKGDDVLVYSYGGWSEGCATGFKFSLLRRQEGGGDGERARVAGITLMFEPGSRMQLAPYSTTSADWPSFGAFLAAIEQSPAWRELAGATPMAAMVESGAVR